MKFGPLKARQTKYAAYATVYIVVIVAVLVIANWLGNRYNKSYDATSNKRFSLSEQTDNLVKKLKEPVTITYFDRTSEFNRAKDLLDRYDALSHKVNVVYVDPDRKPQVAKAAGVKNYGAIYVEAGGKREEAKSLTEEEITSAMIRALKTGTRNVCVVSGSGERNLEDSGRGGGADLKSILERDNYHTRAISLLEKPEVPSDCTVLVVYGPKLDYTGPAVNAIKKYVEGGGRALFMLDPPLKMGRSDTGENAALNKLLQGWGVTLNNDLVLDTSGVGQLFGLGPETPLVSRYESQPIVKDLKGEATVFPLARSLDAKSADKTTVETLFQTSGESYATSNLSSQEIRIDPKRDKHGPLTLAAAGKYNSGKTEGRFVVVGSSNWAANGVLTARSFCNRDLLGNMVNWLASDEDLISIRPKEAANRPLSLTRNQMSLMFYSCLFIVPLLVIAGGVSVWAKRR